MGGSNDKTQSTNSGPWGAAQPYLLDVFKNANDVFNNGQATTAPYGSSINAPLSSYTTNALNQTASLAGQPMPGLDNAYAYANNMMANNGMTADLNRTAGYLTPFANGSMQEDPRLQAMLDTNAQRAGNAAATQFGGGRYGSNAIGQGVGQAVANANNATMLQSNENARNRQMQAAGILGGLYENGLGRAAGAAAMLPTLNNLRYDGVSRLAGVGDFYDQRNQNQLNQDIQNYYTQAGAPKNAVEWLSGIYNGMGNLGGQSTQTASQKPSAAQGILGGAAAGASMGSMFGPWGTAIGGLGGGILGAIR